MGDDGTAGGPGLVLLVGAPRSGTTWLQSMLGAHASVASPQETDLFRRYLEPLTQAWRWQLRGGPEAWAKRRFKGLPAVLTAEEFTEVARGLLGAILEKAAALEPGATVVVEKSPSHSLCGEVVAELAPQARVVHLVRDGRDVVSSLLAASEGWGRWWAPRTFPHAARSWVEHVHGARQIAALGVATLEVRYEELVRRDTGVLREVHAFCGLEVGEQECAGLYESFSFERMSGAAPPRLLVGGEFGTAAQGRAEPEGFFRRGRIAGWRDEWSPLDRLVFDAVAGDLLVELGYERDRRWAGSPIRALLYRTQAGAAAVVASAGHRVGQRAERFSARFPRR